MKHITRLKSLDDSRKDDLIRTRTDYALTKLAIPLLVYLAIGRAAVPNTSGAELAVLSPQTWDEYAPHGKEVDCIYGDFVLRNDKIIAVVAKPVQDRHANVTVRQVGGAIIDLTERDAPNDQLSAFYPGARNYHLDFYSLSVGGAISNDLTRLPVRGQSVQLHLTSPTISSARPSYEVIYSLSDGDPYIVVQSIYTNRSSQSLTITPQDEIRADGTFEKASSGRSQLFWAYDKWFGQAYGVVAEGHMILNKPDRPGKGVILEYLFGERERIVVAPGQRHVLTSRLFPSANLIQLRSLSRGLHGDTLTPVTLSLKDTSGKAVPDADVALVLDREPYGHARTAEDGTLRWALPLGTFQITISALGRSAHQHSFQVGRGEEKIQVQVPVAARVVAKITDETEKPIPCKVQFQGVDGTPSPDFGPNTGEYAVKNLYYSPNGRFAHVIPPGTYQVLISRGPEYDAVFTRLDVPPGQDVALRAILRRVVKTPGWVSADFHNHSTLSGDNTTSQLGRVLNLVAEHIEFAPSTEHNRLSTYSPVIQELGIEDFLATAVGLELTGIANPVNHENAFPLILKPHTQDEGAPQHDDDPQVQIQRLALWDGVSEKLVQQNHPDIGELISSGTLFGGYRKMFGFMDVIEVHPLETILPLRPFYQEGKDPRLLNNPIFNWLQLLNQGYRLPGVVNTDAHYTFHGSGSLRNYLFSPTDNPREINTLDIVRAAEQGRVVMTNGPFLEVLAKTESGGTQLLGIPGDLLTAPDGQVVLQVRVQCPNWFNVDRVQVLVNGRPSSDLNFTRGKNPERFNSGVVKFDQQISISLPSDAHLIVVALGEQSKLGPVMGPESGQVSPLAVSNPIYVDVGKDGFQPNGDTLDVPLPVERK